MKRRTLFIGMVVLLLTSLVAGVVGAAAPPEPTYDVADVDGNTSEWDLNDDFFANMYRAGNSTKELESRLYLRYDCDAGVLYALVLTESGVTARANQPNDAFVKLGNSTTLVNGNSGDDGVAPDFAWVGQDDNTALGYEASTPLAQGTYNNLNVHVQVNDGGSQTSAVEDRAIDLVLTCPVYSSLLVFKYNDLDDSGTHDDGELGLEGWEFTVYDGDPNLGGQPVMGPLSTGPDGLVEFVDLEVGTYWVCETLQSGWENTDPGGFSPYCKEVEVVADTFSPIPGDGSAVTLATSNGTYDIEFLGTSNNGLTWEYEVTEVSGNGLEYWVLGLCAAPLDHSGPGTYSFGPDTGGQSTGISGAKWEVPDNYDTVPGNNNDSEVFSVTFNQAYGATSVSVGVNRRGGGGSGQTATGTITGPDCQPRDPLPPEAVPFGNRELPGSITIVKDATPESDQAFFFIPSGDQNSIFNLVDDGDNDLSEQQIFADLPPGQYTFEEIGTAGWDLTGISCDAADWSVDNHTATINLAADEDVTCTFSNAKHGTLIVEKQTEPDSSLQAFGFSGAVSGDLLDGETLELEVSPGPYTVTEAATAGWDLTGITCTDGNSSGDVGTRTASFNIEAGETVTCTFTNTQHGMLIVEKQTEPNGSLQAFGFSGAVSGDLLDGETLELSVSPGPYTVTEAATAGWDLTGITCTDGNSSGDVGTRTASFNIEAGETVTCTFTNTAQPGSITIVKVVDNVEDDPTGFTFTGDLGQLIIAETSALTLNNLDHGTYVVTEQAEPGYNFTSLSCEDGGVPSTTDGATATINLDPGEEVICTYTNTKQIGHITIVKSADVEDDTPFDFTGDLGDFTLMDPSDNTATFDVEPGLYTVTEAALAGWRLDNLVCTGDLGNTSFVYDQENAVIGVQIDLADDANVTCTFYNEENLGHITIVKSANPENDTPFDFTGDLGDFALMDPSDNTATFDVEPGLYTVTEAALANWKLDNLVCTGDAGNTSFVYDQENALIGVQIDLADDANVTCTFYNVYVPPTGSITVTKAIVGDGTGTFTICLSGGPENLAEDCQPFNGDGAVHTWDNLPVGDGYVIHEQDAGPNWDEPTDQNASVVADETTSVTVTNTYNPPVGTLEVTKVVEWGQASVDSGKTFEVCITGPEDRCDSIDSDGGVLTFANLTPGSYTVSETDPGAEWSVVIAPNPVEVVANQTASVTVTNTNTYSPPQYGTLEVTKVVEWGQAPVDSGKTFEVCITGPEDRCDSIDYDGGVLTFANLTPGSYTVSETDPGAEWSVVIAPNPVEVVANQTASVTVTNTNTYEPPQYGTLEVTKVVEWGQAAVDSGKTFEVCISGPEQRCDSIDYDGGVLTFANLTPGSYTVSETDPGAEWSVVIAPNPVDVAANQTASVTVTNTNTFVPPDECDEHDFNPNRDLRVLNGRWIHDEGTYAWADVRNRSEVCGYYVNMAAYKVFDGSVETQELFDTHTGDPGQWVGPGETVRLTVDLCPNCQNQVDVFWGNIIQSFAGGELYSYNPNRLLAAMHTDGPFCVHDSDHDGVPDDQDACPFDPNDAVGDPCNHDEDNDTVPDEQDACPFDPNDAVGDPCNHDEDNDNVPDEVDVCPGFDDNADADSDTIPDGCDPDDDNDGVDDNVDQCPGVDDTIDLDNDTIPDCIDPLISTAVSVAKTTSDGTTTFTVGATVSYLLTVSNTGPVAATNVTLQDIQPPGITFISASFSGPVSCITTTVNSTPALVCTIASLAPGQSTTISLSGNVAAPGAITNSATITADNDSTPGDNESSIAITATEPDSDNDNVPDNQDACPDQGDAGHGITPDGCPLYAITLLNSTGCEVTGTVTDSASTVHPFTIPVGGQTEILAPGGATTLTAGTAPDSACAGASGGTGLDLASDILIDILFGGGPTALSEPSSTGAALTLPLQ